MGNFGSQHEKGDLWVTSEKQADIAIAAKKTNPLLTLHDAKRQALYQSNAKFAR
jgi:hypothetical protein